MATILRFGSISPEDDAAVREVHATIRQARKEAVRAMLESSTFLSALRELRRTPKGAVLPVGGKSLMGLITTNPSLSLVRPPEGKKPSKDLQYAKAVLDKVVSLLYCSGNPSYLWSLLGQAFRYLPHPSMPEEDRNGASKEQIHQVTAEALRLRSMFLFEYGCPSDAFTDAVRSFESFMKIPATSDRSSLAANVVALGGECLLAMKQCTKLIAFLKEAEQRWMAKFAKCADAKTMVPIILDLQDGNRKLDEAARNSETGEEKDEPDSGVDSNEEESAAAAQSRKLEAGALEMRRQQREKGGPMIDFPNGAIIPKVDPKSPTGWKLEALRDIAAGEVLAILRPSASALHPTYRYTKCANCFEDIGHDYYPCYSCIDTKYCKDACRSAHRSIHRHECTVVSYLVALSRIGLELGMVIIFRLIVQFDLGFWKMDMKYCVEKAGRPLTMRTSTPGGSSITFGSADYPNTEYDLLRGIDGHLQNRSNENILECAVTAGIILNILEWSYLRNCDNKELKLHISMVLFYHILASPKCLLDLTAVGIRDATPVPRESFTMPMHGSISTMKQPTDPKINLITAKKQLEKVGDEILAMAAGQQDEKRKKAQEDPQGADDRQKRSTKVVVVVDGEAVFKELKYQNAKVESENKKVIEARQRLRERAMREEEALSKSQVLTGSNLKNGSIPPATEDAHYSRQLSKGGRGALSSKKATRMDRKLAKRKEEAEKANMAKQKEEAEKAKIAKLNEVADQRRSVISTALANHPKDKAFSTSAFLDLMKQTNQIVQPGGCTAGSEKKKPKEKDVAGTKKRPAGSAEVAQDGEKKRKEDTPAAVDPKITQETTVEVPSRRPADEKRIHTGEKMDVNERIVDHQEEKVVEEQGDGNNEERKKEILQICQDANVLIKMEKTSKEDLGKNQESSNKSWIDEVRRKINEGLENKEEVVIVQLNRDKRGLCLTYTSLEAVPVEEEQPKKLSKRQKKREKKRLEQAHEEELKKPDEEESKKPDEKLEPELPLKKPELLDTVYLGPGGNFSSFKSLMAQEKPTEDAAAMSVEVTGVVDAESSPALESSDAAPEKHSHTIVEEKSHPSQEEVHLTVEAYTKTQRKPSVPDEEPIKAEDKIPVVKTLETKVPDVVTVPNQQDEEMEVEEDIAVLQQRRKKDAVALARIMTDLEQQQLERKAIAEAAVAVSGQLGMETGEEEALPERLDEEVAILGIVSVPERVEEDMEISGVIVSVPELVEEEVEVSGVVSVPEQQQNDEADGGRWGRRRRKALLVPSVEDAYGLASEVNAATGTQQEQKQLQKAGRSNRTDEKPTEADDVNLISFDSPPVTEDLEAEDWWTSAKPAKGAAELLKPLMDVPGSKADLISGKDDNTVMDMRVAEHRQTTVPDVIAPRVSTRVDDVIFSTADEPLVTISCDGLVAAASEDALNDPRALQFGGFIAIADENEAFPDFMELESGSSDTVESEKQAEKNGKSCGKRKMDEAVDTSTVSGEETTEEMPVPKKAKETSNLTLPESNAVPTPTAAEPQSDSPESSSGSSERKAAEESPSNASTSSMEETKAKSGFGYCQGAWGSQAAGASRSSDDGVRAAGGDDNRRRAPFVPTSDPELRTMDSEEEDISATKEEYCYRPSKGRSVVDAFVQTGPKDDPLLAEGDISAMEVIIFGGDGDCPPERVASRDAVVQTRRKGVEKSVLEQLEDISAMEITYIGGASGKQKAQVGLSKKPSVASVETGTSTNGAGQQDGDISGMEIYYYIAKETTSEAQPTETKCVDAVTQATRVLAPDQLKDEAKPNQGSSLVEKEAKGGGRDVPLMSWSEAVGKKWRGGNGERMQPASVPTKDPQKADSSSHVAHDRDFARSSGCARGRPSSSRTRSNSRANRGGPWRKASWTDNGQMGARRGGWNKKAYWGRNQHVDKKSSETSRLPAVPVHRKPVEVMLKEPADRVPAVIAEVATPMEVDDDPSVACDAGKTAQPHHSAADVLVQQLDATPMEVDEPLDVAEVAEACSTITVEMDLSVSPVIPSESPQVEAETQSENVNEAQESAKTEKTGKSQVERSTVLAAKEPQLQGHDSNMNSKDLKANEDPSPDVQKEAPATPQRDLPSEGTPSCEPRAIDSNYAIPILKQKKKKKGKKGPAPTQQVEKSKEEVKQFLGKRAAVDVPSSYATVLKKKPNEGEKSSSSGPETKVQDKNTEVADPGQESVTKVADKPAEKAKIMEDKSKAISTTAENKDTAVKKLKISERSVPEPSKKADTSSKNKDMEEALKPTEKAKTKTEEASKSRKIEKASVELFSEKAGSSKEREGTETCLVTDQEKRAKETKENIQPTLKTSVSPKDDKIIDKKEEALPKATVEKKKKEIEEPSQLPANVDSKKMKSGKKEKKGVPKTPNAAEAAKETAAEKDKETSKALQEKTASIILIEETDQEVKLNRISGPKPKTADQGTSSEKPEELGCTSGEVLDEEPTPKSLGVQWTNIKTAGDYKMLQDKFDKHCATHLTYKGQISKKKLLEFFENAAKEQQEQLRAAADHAASLEDEGGEQEKKPEEVPKAKPAGENRETRKKRDSSSSDEPLDVSAFDSASVSRSPAKTDKGRGFLGDKRVLNQYDLDKPFSSLDNPESVLEDILKQYPNKTPEGKKKEGKDVQLSDMTASMFFDQEGQDTELSVGSPTLITSLSHLYTTDYSEVGTSSALEFGCNKEVTDHSCGSAVYAGLRYFNHSCDPNAIVAEQYNDLIYIRAAKPIKRTEEVTIAYNNCDTYKESSRDKRRLAIKTIYQFICQCPACTENRPVPRKPRRSDEEVRIKCPSCSAPCLVNLMEINNITSKHQSKCHKCEASLAPQIERFTDCCTRLEVLEGSMLRDADPKFNADAMNQLWSNVRDMYDILVTPCRMVDETIKEILLLKPLAGHPLDPSFNLEVYKNILSQKKLCQVTKKMLAKMNDEEANTSEEDLEEFRMLRQEFRDEDEAASGILAMAAMQQTKSTPEDGASATKKAAADGKTSNNKKQKSQRRKR